MVKKKYILERKIALCLSGLFVMGLVWFLWFFLLGNFYALIFGLIPVKPELARGSIYADDWMYTCVLLFSYTGMILTIILTYKMVNNYKDNSLWYVKRATLWSVILFATFMIINPRFSIQFAPQLFGFTDIKKEYVTSTKLYFFWIDKFGFDFVGDYKFKTLDDVIQGLEYAKNNNNKLMYEYIYDEIKNDRLELILNKYQDKTFQTYFLEDFLYIAYDKGETQREKLDAKSLFDKIAIVKQLKVLTKDSSILGTITEVLNNYQKYTNSEITEIDFFNLIDGIREKFYKSKVEGAKFRVL